MKDSILAFSFSLSACLLLAFRFNKQPQLTPDPEGGAHGCAPFFDRAMEWRVEKSREAFRLGIAVSGKALFFGSVSFWPEKEMNSAAQRTKALHFLREACLSMTTSNAVIRRRGVVDFF